MARLGYVLHWTAGLNRLSGLHCPRSGLAVIGLVKVNVDGLERGEAARAGQPPRSPDEGPPGGAPRRQSRDLRDPRRLE